MEFTKRSKVNLLNLFITISIIFVAVQLPNGGLATHINKLATNLKAIFDLTTHIDFADITKNVSYKSNVVYDPKGMHGLYNITNMFMDLIIDKEAVDPNDFFIVDNGRVKLDPIVNNWQNLLKTYAGLLAIIIILLIFVVFMPFCGFCFCCCRCCGKCGSRSQPYDKKHDFCKKFVYATSLIALGTCLLFCVVCAFASNEQVNDGFNHLTKDLKKGIDDISMYIEATSDELDMLLNKDASAGGNFGQFNEVLQNSINDASDVFYKQMAEFTNASSMESLSEMVNKTKVIRNNLTDLKRYSNELRNYASQLNDALRQLKKDLLETLKKCSAKTTQCQKLSNQISQLQTNIHFNNIPDLRDIIKQVETIAENSNLTDVAAKAVSELENIKATIRNKVGDTLDKVQAEIDKANIEIDSKSDEIKNKIAAFKEKLTKTSNNGLQTADDYIRNYFKYWHYVGLAISCVLLLISMCIVLGLICGICGKRPNGYGDDCCNKGAGSQFLMCGVMVMFISGFLIALIVLVTFIVGIVGQRLVCDPLDDPANSKIITVIDDLNYFGNINGLEELKIKEVLVRCKADMAIHDVLSLNKITHIDEVKNYTEKFDISNILSDLGKIDVSFNVTLIDQATRIKLKALGDSDELNSGLDTKLTKFLDELENSNFTTIKLTDLSGNIDEILQLGLDDKDLVNKLQLSKLQLDTYQTRIVDPMVNIAIDSKRIITEIQTDIKFGKGSFKEAIDNLIDEINNAENIFNNDQEIINKVKEITNMIAKGLIRIIKLYLDRVYDSVTTIVGKCAPLYNVLNTTKTSACANIILRWNGFWFSLFWAIILYIPIIIISVKLATLYQKYNPYAGSLIEARNGKVKKKKHKRREERALTAAQGDMVAREYPGGSHPQETRYADMAPKQWEDFPAGGPPQYQRAPTEYERPPPYYYPGNEDNHP